MEKNKLILIASLILALAVVIQGFYIMDLRQKISDPKLTTSNSEKFPGLKHSWFDEDDNQLFDVFKNFDDMQREMDQLFGHFSLNNRGKPHFDNVFGRFTSSPAMDFIEEEDRYLIKVDLPGADDSSIDIDVENGILTLSAETSEQSDEDNSSYRRSERYTGKLQRVLTLPVDANPAEMTTSMENGVLIIILPKHV